MNKTRLLSSSASEEKFSFFIQVTFIQILRYMFWLNFHFHLGLIEVLVYQNYRSSQKVVYSASHQCRNPFYGILDRWPASLYLNTSSHGRQRGTGGLLYFRGSSDYQKHIHLIELYSSVSVFFMLQKTESTSEDGFKHSENCSSQYLSGSMLRRISDTI